MYANLTDDGRTHRTYSDDNLPWQNRRTTFWGLVIPLTIFSWLSVGLRLHVRIFKLRCPGWDDVLIVAALVTATISAIFLCISAEYGLGHRSADVFAYDKVIFFKVVDIRFLLSLHFAIVITGLTDTANAGQLFWVANAVFTMSNALVKLSLLAQYLRVFTVPIMRLTCKILICLVAIWGTIYSFIAWFPCFPPSEFYNFTGSSSCYGYGSPVSAQVYQTTVSATASNMAFDVVTWALPIHLLVNKALERKTQTALVCLLILGLIILGLAAGRCLANGSTAQAKPDPFWNFPVIVLVGESENRFACMLGSIPIFWPVVERAAERIHGLYRILITEEFIVGSSRALPGEVSTDNGAYETPHWAEQPDEALQQNTYGSKEWEQDILTTPSDLRLPRPPEPTALDISGSETLAEVNGSDVLRVP